MGTTQVTDCEFVEDLDLEGLHSALYDGRKEGKAKVRGRIAAAMASLAGATKKATPTANINSGALVTFSADLTADQRQDVNDSLLIAELGADAGFNRYSAPIDWYKKYTEILTRIGWAATGWSFTKYDASGTKFTVAGELLKLLLAVASQDELKVMNSAVEAVKSLSDGSKAVVLFETQSHNLTMGNFQVGSASITKGQVSMALGASHFNTSSNVTKVLFFEFSKASTNMYYASQRVILNENVYNGVRSTVQKKLGKLALKYVEDLILA